MQQADRVRPWRIRRLYELAQLSLYDDDLLLEVGWGLYARCLDILAVTDARNGKVPCPECGHTVYRQWYFQPRRSRTVRPSTPTSRCPECDQPVAWRDCRDALKKDPVCFDCRVPLTLEHIRDQLSCPECRQQWSLSGYRKSVGYRTRLPCPRCGMSISKRDLPVEKLAHRVSTPSDDPWWGELICPRCRQRGHHPHGRFECLSCGYTERWQAHLKRLKRRVERLTCESCGHTFTWQWWRKSYGGPLTSTGNPEPLRAYGKEWPTCKDCREQMVKIDVLLHTLHGRGALAPLFIRGNDVQTMQLLDQLASHRGGLIR